MRVKSSVSLLAVFCLLSFASVAQTYEGEYDICLSYGVYSGRQFADQGTMDNNGDGTQETSNSGNIFITGRYFLESRFSVGITAGFQTIKGGVYYYDGILENTYSMINKTIAAEMTMVYMNKRRVQMYVLTGFGVSMSSVTSNDPVNNSYTPGIGPTMIFEPMTGTRFNWQLDPVCIRVGGKLAGFAELGLGYKGILNAGISYRVGKQKKSSAIESDHSN